MDIPKKVVVVDRWALRSALANISVALALALVLVPRFKSLGPQDQDVLLRVMGGAADIAAESAYRQADVYFHAGAMEECPLQECTSHDVFVEPKERARLPLAGFVRQLHGETAPKTHRHLQGNEEKEILPWFVTAVRLNPRHIEAWRAGSYWFYRIGDIERAEEFICDAICRNPQDYRLYLDRGILYHRLKRWEEATRSLEVALDLWQKDTDEAEYDLRAIRAYLADSRTYSREARSNH